MTEMKELLLEIGTEEIPAGFIPHALTDLERLGAKEFEAYRIDIQGMRTLGTPRRLVLLIGSVSEKQRDVETKKMGPSKQAAFDSKGNPTKAAIGFAKSQSVSVEALRVIQTEKGEYVFAVKEETGRPTFELLPSLLSRLVVNLPFPKSMRWGEVPIRFARPIHWMVALFDGAIVTFEAGNVQSGNRTCGHRFMHPGSFAVQDIQSYLKKTKDAYVIVDPTERKKRIEEEMNRVAASVQGKVLRDEDLLNEVNFLVEYPVALRGKFDPKFLSLPREIVTHSMKEHQKYFPLEDDRGNLLPYFVCISNTDPKDRTMVVKGNERVLKARFSDAEFFFKDDLKIPLEKRLEQLKKVVFQAKLGTSYEKVMRFTQLALFICELVEPKLRKTVERASLLCKADLVTGMVGEFPKLQGVVGKEYARLSGETPEVFQAIYEHYLPAFAGDRLPDSPVGDMVSIADKLDTIVGCFGVGLVPTGTADPFGLRRQALGIIRIILEKRYPLSLLQLIEESGKLLKAKMERSFIEVKTETIEFFRVRYQNLLLEKGYPFDVVDAVLSTSFDELIDVQHRLDALKAGRMSQDFESVVIGFKRAMNILKGVASRQGVDPSLFSEAAEKDLYQSFLKAKEVIELHLKQRAYESAILEMTRMRKPIDTFFNKVMVMVEDEKIRNNRLALLDGIGQLFLRIADFSRLTS